MDFEKMRTIRKAKHKSQEDLAKFLGVNRATVSKYETGIVEPPLAQLARIAAFLEVPTSELLGRLESFNTGEEFQARWKELTQNSEPGVEIQYRADGSQIIIDRRKAKLDGVYHQLDDTDQLQLIKYGEFLLDDPKYKEDPPQD